MTETVAGGQLRAFIERILRLKEEQDTIAADIREVYAEAKGTGFDKTTMGQLVAHLRKVEKIGAPAIEESQTMFDLYLDAFQGASGTRVATHTHEKPKSPSQAAVVTDDHLREPVAAASGQIVREDGDAPQEASDGGNLSDTESLHPSPLPSPPTDESPAPDPNPAPGSPSPDHASPTVDDGRPSTPSTKAARAKNDDAASVVVGQEHVRGNLEQAVTNPSDDVPAFVMKDRQPSPAPNPDCQNPKSCRWSHSQASCAKCATDAAIARQCGRAA